MTTFQENKNAEELGIDTKLKVIIQKITNE
jgi:hypothetical protein